MPDTQGHGQDRGGAGVDGAQLRWLHALARRLASNEADAEDLVQETLLVGRDAPGAPSDPGALRRWLGGVLRNREKMQRRAEGRRRRREADVEPAEDDLDLEHAMHRARVLASLREALDELDDDERALLLTRYCDDVPAPELAARLGIPASTVRTRLGRATSRMRARLDERWGGDRRGWAPAVLVSLPVRRTGVGLGALGGLWMASKLVKLVVVVAVALTVGGAWWIATRRGAVQEDPPRAGVTRTEDAELVSRLQQRRGVAGARAEGSLEGIVVDVATRRPIPGAVIALAPRTGAPVLRADGAAIPHARSDASGAFVVDAPEGEYHLTAAAAGYVPAAIDTVEVGADGERTVVALRPGGTRIEGTLTDITGGEIEGALVVARPASGGRVGVAHAGIAALSDAEGHYVLSLGEGRWSIEAGGDDYARAQRRVSIRRAAARVDFQLVPAAAIHGRVLDRATGAPVADAAVGFERYVARGRGFSVDMAKPDEMARTAADGGFVLRGLPPGSYSVFATAKSRASVVEAVVAVAFGEQVDGVEVLVDPAFDASGFVVDAAAREHGLADVNVVAVQARPARQWHATTDASGYFELQGLPAGSVSLMLEGEGAVPSSLEHTLRVDGDGRGAPQVFALERGATLRGQVRGQDDPSPATVKVVPRARTGGFELLAQQGKVAGATARVAEDGTFTITGVPSGEWRLEADGDDGSAGEVEIAVTPAGLEGLDVTLVPRAIVKGVVRDGEGRPLHGVSAVLALDRDLPFHMHRGSPEAAVMADAEGRFEILGVAPGDWSVLLFDDAGQGVTPIGEAPRAVIREGDMLVEIDVRAELPRGRITGVVVDAAGAPVADAWVDAEPGARPTVTDAEGRFAFERLAEGSFSIHARARHDGARGIVEEVAPGSDVRVEVELPAGIRGTVSMNGKPVERFTVTVGELGRPQTFLSPDGSFELDRLRPGEHSLAVASAEGAISVTTTLRAGEIAAVPVSLGAWGRVTGRVISAVDGAPLVGIEIGAEARSGRRSPAEGGVVSLLSGGPSTDAAGRFEIEGLGAGALELRFQAGSTMMGGEALGRHTATLGPGETLDLGDVVALPPVAVPREARGWLGFESRLSARPASSPAASAAEGRGAPRHVWVHFVAPNGAAAAAGVRVGDRIDAIDGLDASRIGAATLLDAMRPARLEVGTTHELTVSRDGAQLRFSIEVRPQR